MAVYLENLALQYYRGIGPEEQMMTGFSDINLFIGPNNAGKSIILEFIAKYLPLTTANLKTLRTATSNNESFEKHDGNESQPAIVKLGMSKTKFMDAFKSLKEDYQIAIYLEDLWDQHSTLNTLWLTPHNPSKEEWKAETASLFQVNQETFDRISIITKKHISPTTERHLVHIPRDSV